MAQQEGSAIPQCPVVIQWVDGGSQWLQDTVQDTAHQRADIGPQAEVWVPNQAPCHLQEPVQLLQVMAYRLHLLGEEGCLGGHGGAREPARPVAPACEPTACCIISSPQTRPCRSLVTYPTDHINKVWQERCNLGVGLQVLESNLKQKGPCCPGPSTPSINWYLFKGKLGIYVLTS